MKGAVYIMYNIRLLLSVFSYISLPLPDSIRKPSNEGLQSSLKPWQNPAYYLVRYLI